MGHWPLVVGLAVGALLTPARSGAQTAYVPLDDVAYVYIDALIARGELRGLSVLERPYTVEAVRRALAPAPSPIPRRRWTGRVQSVPRATPATRELRSRLQTAVAKYDFAGRAPASPVRAELSASLWITGETSGQRELLLADQQDPRAFAGGALRFLMRGGPVVAFSRPILENRLNSDPDFRGRTDRRIAGRTEDAYLAGQWRFGELFFGRVARNWGPAQHQGLLISDAPFTYDHLFGRLGTQRLNVSTLLARADDNPRQDGQREQRYLATHRIAGRWRGLEFALSEAFLYGGVARSFEPSLANPFNVYALTWRNEGLDGNLLGSLEVAARTRAGIIAGQLLIDDLQLDRCDVVCEEPSSYGYTLSAEGLPLLAGQRAFVSYTRVSNLTYRTPTDFERYAMHDVSLGRAFSDYDEWRLGADVVAGPAPLRVYFASRRQGAGDYRVPFPPDQAFATHPGFLESPVTRVQRVGVRGGLIAGSFDVRGDVGYNAVRDGSILRAPSVSGFEGRVRLAYHPRWARVRLAP
jgi:hypothetical protein